MNKDEILKIFKETGVMLEGHFLLTSGRHSDKYMQCAKLFVDPKVSEKFTAKLAQKFYGVDIVAGPAVGGIILAYETARQLGVTNVFFERQDGKMTLRRGFEIPKDANVLVVEDVVTTGGSVKEVVQVIKNIGANVIGVGSIVDRSNGKVDFGVPFEAVLSMGVVSYEADDCPLCEQGIPAVKPGSRSLK